MTRQTSIQISQECLEYLFALAHILQCARVQALDRALEHLARLTLPPGQQRRILKQPWQKFSLTPES
jgi:hypothetical protein